MLNIKDIPADASFMAQQTIDMTDESAETAADAGVILGQLDPTEIDLSTGLPRWTDSQRALILKFNDALAEWRE